MNLKVRDNNQILFVIMSSVNNPLPESDSASISVQISNYPLEKWQKTSDILPLPGEPLALLSFSMDPFISGSLFLNPVRLWGIQLYVQAPLSDLLQF